MTSSTRCTILLCLITIFVETQGHPRLLNGTSRKNFVKPSCCQSVSSATISSPVDGCFQQNKNMFSSCKIDAYIFTKGEKAWCVDPNAQWLPDRLNRLQARGIICKPLSQLA